MAVSSLMNAGISYLKLAADPESQLAAITYWLMGSLSGAETKDLLTAGIPVLAGSVPLFMLRWRINLLTLGDEEADTLGIDAGKLRKTVILCSTLITAATVSVTGIIGWVGLLVPHICRRIVGNNCRFLLPASMIFGAGFLLAVDDITRIFFPAEIPIGILTSFIGVPFFLYLITRKGDRL